MTLLNRGLINVGSGLIVREGEFEPVLTLWHKVSVTTSWLQLSLKATPAALDPIANFLIERGSPGVVLHREEVQAFFPASQGASSLKSDIRRFLKGINEIYPGIARYRPRWTVLKDKRWNSSWRRFFSPQKVAKGFLITPPWIRPSRPGRRKVITIEPGMAFGTGSHPTTRGCLEFLEEVVQPLTPKRLTALDVGTGSGILAIALAKMGLTGIVALDNDPVAIKVAEENVRLNRVGEAVKLLERDIRRVRGSFTVVVANLTAETIVGLAPVLSNKVSRRGFLILSGILDQRAPGVISHFVRKSFALARKKRSKGWTTLALVKNN
ncbi:MAG: 50S ribosomal protein L11 methyltransferase [Candidatus Binatia bacterium]